MPSVTFPTTDFHQMVNNSNGTTSVLWGDLGTEFYSEVHAKQTVGTPESAAPVPTIQSVMPEIKDFVLNALKNQPTKSATTYQVRQWVDAAFDIPPGYRKKTDHKRIRWHHNLDSLKNTWIRKGVLVSAAHGVWVLASAKKGKT